MRKLSTILLAVALVLGLAQCKKEQPATPQSEGNVVTITLNVGDNNGPRVNVDPTGNQVTFTGGDQILVASGGKYVGSLDNNGTTFSGNVSEADLVENQPLYFYFLGNKQGELQTGVTTCTVNISDQTTEAGLPVISMGRSIDSEGRIVKYVPGTTSFTSRLYNKCSLQKFNVTTSSTAAICITGMNNKVTVNFGNPTDEGFEYGMDGEGVIKMHGVTTENTETWAIVLPQDELPAGEEGSVYTYDNAYIGTRPAIHAIESNKMYHEGNDVISMTLEAATPSVPTGAIKGLFTVSDNAEGTNTYQIYFSKGNLQYQASSDTWQFAEHQWDYIGSANSNISSTYSGWIDLFGWGTSGYHNNNDPYNVNYNPWSNSYSYGNNDYNSYGYGPSMNQTDQALVRTSAHYDWGVHNPISNGGNQAGQWKTMTRYAWVYVFEKRSGIRYAKAKVNDVNGVILLPDDWSSETYTLNSTNVKDASFSSNTISALQWNTLEQAGAVFLPAAEYRYNGTTVSEGNGGRYWSASQENKDQAKGMYFNASKIDTYKICPRCHGLSVRLVHVAEN